MHRHYPRDIDAGLSNDMHMNHIDLKGMTLSELLQLRNAIDIEIAARGHTRTASSLAGELIERTVSVAYSGELVKVGSKSVDVVTGNGRRLQVKTRSLPRGDLRHWAFSNFDFDAAIVVAVDRETLTVDWARELSSNEVRTLARPHATDGWRLGMATGRSEGIDVTDPLRRAFQKLS
ncbi:hypothetical protein QNO08_03140 [Arthrobacter sp. zg-Y820]|uniref:hypothetical protein n=1 Tax=unclassified Arthrobacter TaxID=235627 RepID=UPI001E429E6D|nr:MULTISPECIES: hypothetical protein [unclassified Arthrobacter]MCC9195329.1 hypothetical protein [Arthrobacter sp. zg-Y820]MDK1278188.1 hypothetical protein [Arthrobacter sp. zg.Y820]WIB10073.1 hypothetical protein QNO08_03140 [Arthrobacter sp. zg-Y820]